MSQEKPMSFEEKYVTVLYRAGIFLGIFTLITASFFAFALSLARLGGVLIFLSGVQPDISQALLDYLGITDKPLILVLIDIVDAALVGAILIILAFGLRSVFTGKRFKIMSFGIRDIDELKEYLVGLIITLIGTRFLERVLRAEQGSEIFTAGIGVAAAIIALGVYDYILKQHKEPGE